MKFGVTSKSGHSVIIDAPNYKAAQKEAERRFGKGVIVQLVGNASTNPIVANALKTVSKDPNDRQVEAAFYRGCKADLNKMFSALSSFKAAYNGYTGEINQDFKNNAEDLLGIEMTVQRLQGLCSS